LDDTGEAAPEPNPAAGEYQGKLSWSIPDWDWTICDMDLSIEIDDEGKFEEDDRCIYEGQDGNDYDLDINIAGQVDEDGKVGGKIDFVSWAVEGWSSYYLESYSGDLEGQVDGDEMYLDFYDEAQLGNNGQLGMPGFISVER
jgi:hypothetical protein